MSKDCLDQHVLTLAGSDENTYTPHYSMDGEYEIDLQLPPDMVCSQCIIQWTYTTGRRRDVSTKINIHARIPKTEYSAENHFLCYYKVTERLAFCEYIMYIEKKNRYLYGRYDAYLSFDFNLVLTFAVLLICDCPLNILTKNEIVIL